MMRNSAFIVALLALFFAGCQETAVKIGEDFLSYKSNELDITIVYSVFSAQQAEVEQGCKAVNGAITV